MATKTRRDMGTKSMAIADTVGTVTAAIVAEGMAMRRMRTLVRVTATRRDMVTKSMVASMAARGMPTVVRVMVTKIRRDMGTKSMVASMAIADTVGTVTAA